MKEIDRIYKDWSGNSHLVDSGHPVHDSAAVCDFAEYYHKEMIRKNNNKKLDKYEFKCDNCGNVEKMTPYAVAQLSSGNSLNFVCYCKNVIKLKPFTKK